MLRPQLRVGPWCPWSGGTHRHLLSIKTPGPKPKSKLTVRSHVLGADLLGPPIASVLCAWGSRGWHLTTWAPWSIQCHFLLKHEDLGLQARQGLCTTGICSPPLLGRACLPSSVEWFGVGGCTVCTGRLCLAGLVLLQRPGMHTPFQQGEGGGLDGLAPVWGEGGTAAACTLKNIREQQETDW